MKTKSSKRTRRAVDISHVIVRRDGLIDCLTVSDSGDCESDWLTQGRYNFEGFLVRGECRYWRLRREDAAELNLVDEEDMNSWPDARRVYRRKAGESRPPAAPVSIDQARTVVEAELKARRTKPELLPGHHLGTYVQFGSVDSWRIEYSIESRGGGWAVHFDKGGGEHETFGPADPLQLVDSVRDSGIDPDDFANDLRNCKNARVAAFGETVYWLGIAKGWIDDPDKEPPAPPPAPARQPRPHPAAVRPPVPEPVATHVRDGEFLIFRHPFERPCSFAAVINIGDSASNLTFKTPDGCHSADVMLEAMRGSERVPVVRVRGEAAPDGRLQVVVTDLRDGAVQVIPVEPVAAY